MGWLPLIGLGLVAEDKLNPYDSVSKNNSLHTDIISVCDKLLNPHNYHRF